MPFAFSIIDIFIFLNIYGLYIIPPAFVGGLMYLVRYLSFPLLTRNPCELVIIQGPDKISVLRVKNRYQPLFTTKKGAYWFSEPKSMKALTIKKTITKRVKKEIVGPKGKPKTITEKQVETEEIQKSISQNKIHIYVEPVNQPVYHTDRIKTKLTDVLTHYNPAKQTKKHAVLIPPSMLSFHRNWALIIKGDTVTLEPTKQKQPYKVRFFTRMGIYIASESSVQSANAAGAASMQGVTVQMIEQKIGSIEQNINFSASVALQSIKDIRYMERKWVKKLIGAIDMKLILIMMAAVMMIAVIFIFFKPGDISSLPPPPAGVSLPK